MENASKALLMAGSILMTIIIVSLLVMAWNNMSQLPKTQEQIKEAEELSEFNKKYESYAKNGIRGTDLVTVVNMANSNNAKYVDEDELQITIKFKITKQLEQVIRKYEYKNGNWEQSKTEQPTYNTVENYYNNTSNISGIDFEQLSNNSKSEFQYALNKDSSDWKNTFEDIETDVFKRASYFYYTRTNVAAEFKRKKFDCKEVKYHENGRISEIYYEEQ